MCADLSLKVLHPPLQFDDLHVEGGLLAPEGSDLLLEPRVLLLLTRKVTLDVLLYLEEFIGESFADVLGLKGKLTFQSGFLNTQLGYVGLIHLELILDLSYEILHDVHTTSRLPQWLISCP